MYMYMYIHNTLFFQEVLLNTLIRGNLDSPEATLEALQQAVVCSEVSTHTYTLYNICTWDISLLYMYFDLLLTSLWNL